jgi:hypothetical protein
MCATGRLRTRAALILRQIDRRKTLILVAPSGGDFLCRRERKRCSDATICPSLAPSKSLAATAAPRSAFMKFFVPDSGSDAEAERVLEGIAKFVGAYVPARRIFKLLYRHNNREFVAEVGQALAAYYEEGQQPVFAILPVCRWIRNLSALTRGSERRSDLG